MYELCSIHMSGCVRAYGVLGLCWNRTTDCLWLACKAQKRASREKHVYAFDLSTHTLSEEPLFVVDLDEVSEALGKKVKAFNPSAIEIHPLTKNVGHVCVWKCVQEYVWPRQSCIVVRS